MCSAPQRGRCGTASAGRALPTTATSRCSHSTRSCHCRSASSRRHKRFEFSVSVCACRSLSVTRINWQALDVVADMFTRLAAPASSDSLLNEFTMDSAKAVALYRMHEKKASVPAVIKQAVKTLFLVRVLSRLRCCAVVADCLPVSLFARLCLGWCRVSRIWPRRLRSNSGCLRSRAKTSCVCSTLTLEHSCSRASALLCICLSLVRIRSLTMPVVVLAGVLWARVRALTTHNSCSANCRHRRSTSRRRFSRLRSCRSVLQVPPPLFLFE